MIVPGSASPLLLSSAGGYNLTKSLRFRSSASAYLNRTPASAGNRKTWTWSGWVKRGTLGVRGTLFHAYDGSADQRGEFYFDSSDRIVFYKGGVSGEGQITTVSVFRDPSAWYHVVVKADYSNGTSADRAIIYVNNVAQTVTINATFANADGQINGNWAHSLGSQATGQYFDGYMAEVNFIDGQQLTPSSFGQTSSTTGVWIPKKYSGTYGTNGFYLKFTDTTSTSTLGNDFSGNGNNWTTNNFSLALSTVVESFTSSTTWTAPTGVTSVNYLVVAGGGGGAYAGGGGAGGYRESTLSVTPGATYTVTVGGGGAGETGFSANSAKGSDSVFSSITSTGGGAGNSNYTSIVAKNNGGSGGGGGIGTTSSGSGTSGQGNAGGAGDAGNAGGGGGASAVGGSATGPFPGFSGNGGAGTTSSISGSSVTRAGGGGGGCSIGVNQNFGTGGAGGGGSSSTSTGNPGSTNTGGGGGAGSYDGTFNNSGAGGSGIVIISYGVGSASTYDSMTDVPTLTSATTANYCVMNPLNQNSTGVTITNGNLDVSRSSSSNGQIWSTMGMTSGKWYAEVTMGDVTEFFPGIANGNMVGANRYLGQDSNTWAYYNDGRKVNSATYTSYGNSYTNGDVIGVAFDADTGALYFYKNGTVQNSGTAAFTGLTSGPYFYACSAEASATANSWNFGQRPFTYTPPTGFLQLNTFNLPTPTIGATASTTANKYMDATTYTGNGGTLAVTNSGSMQPDWVWVKSRSTAQNNYSIDAVRGINSILVQNNTEAESYYDATWRGLYGNLTAFNSNGFTVVDGTDPSFDSFNGSGATYVGWQWKANGAGSTNTAGTITSTVSANTSSGFSVVTYSANGSTGTVGHGLGVAPSMIIVKKRNAAERWCVFHTSTSNAYIYLNETFAAETANANLRFGNNTVVVQPTSTLFTIGNSNDVNGTSGTYVAYCFAQVAGYSAFGSYTGNGSNDGPFIYTGFRPRFIMMKASSAARGWIMFDTARDPYNVAQYRLFANTSDAEFSGTTANNIDIVSNGFKPRLGSNSEPSNESGTTYIYLAFAEYPFKYANAR